MLWLKSRHNIFRKKKYSCRDY